MELNDFKNILKSGTPSGVYIFAGEEDYLKRYYLDRLRERCVGDESLAVFNHSVYSGKDIDFAAILEDIKAPPMMNDFKLIECRHVDFCALAESEYKLLLDIFEEVKDYPQAVVAFLVTSDGFEIPRGKKAQTRSEPKRSKKTAKSTKQTADGEEEISRGKEYYLRQIQNASGFMTFKRSTDAQLYSWLKRHFDAEGVGVGMDVLEALLFRSGRNMDVLEKEVAKISYMVHSRGKSSADVKDVEEAASTTPECDTFDLANALSNCDKELARKALAKMKHERVDPIVIMGMISKTYIELLTVARYVSEGVGASDIERIMGLNPKRTPHLISAAKRNGVNRLSRVVRELARTDASSKYGGIGGYTAIELFIEKCL